MICPGISDLLLKTTNGCGSSYWLAWIFRIPRWFSKGFYCACGCHDLKYQKKGSLLDKWKADDELYDKFYYVAFHSGPVKKRIMLKVADIAYWALGTRLSDLCYLKGTRNEFGKNV